MPSGPSPLDCDVSALSGPAFYHRINLGVLTMIAEDDVAWRGFAELLCERNMLGMRKLLSTKEYHPPLE